MRQPTPEERQKQIRESIVWTIMFAIPTIILFVTSHWIFGIIFLILTILFAQGIFKPFMVDEVVYITKGGEKYHCNKNCSHIKGNKIKQLNESQAIMKKYTKCYDCYK